MYTNKTTQLMSLNRIVRKYFISYTACYLLNKYNSNQTLMMNYFCEIWPRGDACPVAKINMPAGTKTWKNCSSVSVISAAQLERAGV